MGNIIDLALLNEGSFPCLLLLSSVGEQLPESYLMLERSTQSTEAFDKPAGGALKMMEGAVYSIRNLPAEGFNETLNFRRRRP